MAISRPKGTIDIMPQDIKYWHFIEETMRKLCRIYGYEEVRTPIFEHTELFQRGVGETSDIVSKEMYTFEDKGNRSITLRPEGTAPVVRAFVENKLFAEAQPIKLYYTGPMFRYSRPQAGRYRQFNQLGVEAFGSTDPLIDAETIALCMDIFSSVGLKKLELHINSVGCPACRPKHKEALKEFLAPRYNELCPTCQSRYEANPLRIFDCKSEVCQEIVKNAPTITACLCDECKDHLEILKSYLKVCEIEYHLDENLVRGLDYYTKTAFEIMVSDIGAQSSIGGGGRYDSLVEEIGGPDIPGIGFAIGIERVILAMKAQEIALPEEKNDKVFVAFVDDKDKDFALSIVKNLRKAGIWAETEYTGRKLKAQFKYANKKAYTYVITVGVDERMKGTLPLKNMVTGEEQEFDMRSLLKYLQGGN